MAGDAEDTPTSLVEPLRSAEVDDALSVAELPTNSVGGYVQDGGDLLDREVLAERDGDGSRCCHVMPRQNSTL